MSALPEYVSDPDRTAKARIRDAAIARFAAHGVAGTSLKAVAGDAGVSAPLVIHHFGSKDGLRRACDEHVAAVIRDRKSQVMTRDFDALAVLRATDEGPPLMRYLARTLAEGSPQVSDLVDELIDDAVAYMTDGMANGVIKPCDNLRERAVVLAIWNLGALVLHEHVTRHMDADLLGPPKGYVPWALVAAEILAEGVVEESFYERWRAALETYRQEQS